MSWELSEVRRHPLRPRKQITVSRVHQWNAWLLFLPCDMAYKLSPSLACGDINAR
nr:MAG TPA: hypothetical protein [Caudoviricetes sp.]